MSGKAENRESGTPGFSSPDGLAFQRFLARQSPAILARLKKVEGSAPRDEGTFMLISVDEIWGTIGGGFAEFDTIARARALLAEGREEDQRIIILGPDSGQCCGGRLTIDFRRLDPALTAELVREVAQAEQSLRPVVLFGAGHVGKALAQALAPLPFRVTVVETRADEADGLPDTVRSVVTPLPEAELRDLPPGAAVLILTHDHALDFLIASEALMLDGIAYVGMIGSATKRASFKGHWKRNGGDANSLDRLVLPIGGSRVKDKRPAVIAAMVAAELLSLPPNPAITD